MIRVAIVETDVYGVKAYHARCLECGWESRRGDYEKQAIANAKKHYPCPKDAVNPHQISRTVKIS